MQFFDAVKCEKFSFCDHVAVVNHEEGVFRKTVNVKRYTFKPRVHIFLKTFVVMNNDFRDTA